MLPQRKSLDAYVTIRELMHTLFARSHARQLKKVISWAQPSKLLSLSEQNEL
jgi:hypothetical protein